VDHNKRQKNSESPLSILQKEEEEEEGLCHFAYKKLLPLSQSTSINQSNFKLIVHRNSKNPE